MSDPAEILIVGFPEPKFPLGQILATPGALREIPNDEMLVCLRRHASGDWGTMDAEDLTSNNQALANGGRLFSGYESRSGVRFWIITEWDRNHTTILLPMEY